MDEPEAAPTSVDDKKAPTVEKLFAGSSFEHRRQSSMREVEEAKPGEAAAAAEPKAPLTKAKSLTKNKSIKDDQSTTTESKSATAATPKFSLFKRLGRKVVNANKATDKPRSSKDKIPDESKRNKAFVLAAVTDDGSQLNYCQDKVGPHCIY